jgi:hypothetical protein
VSQDPPQFDAPVRHLFPRDRVVERGRGCWNCIGHDHDGEATKKLWQEDKDKLLAEVFEIAAKQEHPQNFIAYVDGLAADPRSITIEVTDSRDLQRVKSIMKTVDTMDRSVGQGAFRICFRNGAGDRGGKYISAQYLCDKWTGMSGTSMATSGHALDKLPDELREDKK